MDTVSTTCKKRWNDFPFAHRQHDHDGHCALIHGHNWAFELTFAAQELDGNGFVIDFGKLGWVKAWLTAQFDHTLVLNRSDPWLRYLTGVLSPEDDTAHRRFAKITVVENCGAEGLAHYVLTAVNEMLTHDDRQLGSRSRGVRCVQCTVYEDDRNSASVNSLDIDW